MGRGRLREAGAPGWAQMARLRLKLRLTTDDNVPWFAVLVRMLALVWETLTRRWEEEGK